MTIRVEARNWSSVTAESNGHVYGAHIYCNDTPTISSHRNYTTGYHNQTISLLPRIVSLNSPYQQRPPPPQLGMKPGWPVAAKRALVLLDQTTHDHVLYETIAHLLSPPDHPNITVLLTQDTIDAIRWVSAVTKFTRLLLFYRYVSGGEPLEVYPNQHSLSAPYVLEQIREWIVSGLSGSFDKEFYTFKVAQRKLKKTPTPARRGTPGQTSEYLQRRMQEFGEGVLATVTGEYVVTDTIYDIFVSRCSLEEGSRIHWALTKQVLKWHNAIQADLLELGKVRPGNCGRKQADGEGVDWKTKGGWRLKGLLPGDIFFPPDYEWRKVKPQAVYDTTGITRIGFTGTTKGLVHQHVNYRTVMADKCKVVTEFRCPICRCDWEPTDAISKLKCGHVFHPECLMTWTCPQVSRGNPEVKPTCPMCRAPQIIERVFHPDTIPFRDPGKRGTGWCWEGNNLLRHSPEHYFLNQQPCRGVARLTHTTLQMWLYVREMYNHGRRHCWAIRELGWAPHITIRPYGGAVILADVSDYNQDIDTMDSRSMPDLDEELEGPENEEFLAQDEIRFRWSDYGWGGITTEYLRELGAGRAEVQSLIEFHPGLAPTLDEGVDQLSADGLPLLDLMEVVEPGVVGVEDEVDDNYEHGFWDDGVEAEENVSMGNTVGPSGPGNEVGSGE